MAPARIHNGPAAVEIIGSGRRRAGTVIAQAGGVHTKGGRVRLAGPAATPVEERQQQLDEVVDPDRPWDVLVWDDPVNLMSYVVFVFRRVFGFTEDVAQKLMLEVHQKGKALVASEPREQAEMYVQQLHGYGLQATMQRST